MIIFDHNSLIQLSLVLPCLFEGKFKRTNVEIAFLGE